MGRKSIAHITLGFHLRGGVQCWIELIARHSGDDFTHYVLTPNARPDGKTACIVPEFSSAEENEPDLRRRLAAAELPEVGRRSRFINEEILTYISDVFEPDVVIIYGNDAQELLLPARLMHARSLIILRVQYHQGLPLQWLREYVDAVILFHDNAVLAGLGKPMLELHRTYDDTVFRNTAPFLQRQSDSVAYFGRFHELKGVAAFHTMLPILQQHGKRLHLYTTPTPPSAQAEIDALIRRYPDNLVCHKWITDPAALAEANNQYRVVVAPGASNNLANTFGQSNLEAIACGAKLIALLDDNNRGRYAHTRGKYLDYEGRLFQAVDNAVDMAYAAIEAMASPDAGIAADAADLKEFGISRQRQRIVEFINDQHARKFGGAHAQG